ncbi:hypothetical protein [Leptolyngbya sp. FACHB-17]|uniref:hypothetical protein n=1 Tax=unclassified Leptolyngbya TaxID=2650499 RepID=UPI00103AA682|nr:hypothetical protein [Leptolyngbya sp. FACHB-17]MBD2083364.1 hypothetical protein [Leptolyngbya sp. FACHB-17]
MAELDRVIALISLKHEQIARDQAVDSLTKLFNCDRADVERLIIQVHPANQNQSKKSRNDFVFND